jgi:hypothetical protein
MLIGLVGRIGTAGGFDFGMDEDYHSRTAKRDGVVPESTSTVSPLIGPVRFWTDSVSAAEYTSPPFIVISLTPGSATIFDLTVNNVAGPSSQLEKSVVTFVTVLAQIPQFGGNLSWFAGLFGCVNERLVLT